jgi:hypothetical protein
MSFGGVVPLIGMLLGRYPMQEPTGLGGLFR